MHIIWKKGKLVLILQFNLTLAANQCFKQQNGIFLFASRKLTVEIQSTECCFKKKGNNEQENKNSIAYRGADLWNTISCSNGSTLDCTDMKFFLIKVVKCCIVF